MKAVLVALLMLVPGSAWAGDIPAEIVGTFVESAEACTRNDVKDITSIYSDGGIEICNAGSACVGNIVDVKKASDGYHLTVQGGDPKRYEVLISRLSEGVFKIDDAFAVKCPAL